MVPMLVQAKADPCPGKNFEVFGPAAGASRKQGTEPASVIISGTRQARSGFKECDCLCRPLPRLLPTLARILR